MTNTSKDPLHGITLKAILEHLVKIYGWEKMGLRIKIKCFTDNPNVTSSLAFLRKTSWAREKVERLYLSSLRRATPAIQNDSPIHLEG